MEQAFGTQLHRNDDKGTAYRIRQGVRRLPASLGEKAERGARLVSAVATLSDQEGVARWEGIVMPK